MAQSYEVKDTGTTRKVAGFRCEVWTVTMAGMSTTQECLTTEVQYPVHAFDAYREFAQGMQSSMSAFGPGAKSAADLAEKRKNMKGFALASSSSIEVMGTKTSIQSEVLEVRHGSMPATAWDIPAGYTKIENPMLKALDRQSHARPAG